MMLYPRDHEVATSRGASNDGVEVGLDAFCSSSGAREEEDDDNVARSSCSRRDDLLSSGSSSTLLGTRFVESDRSLLGDDHDRDDRPLRRLERFLARLSAIRRDGASSSSSSSSEHLCSDLSEAEASLATRATASARTAAAFERFRAVAIAAARGGPRRRRPSPEELYAWEEDELRDELREVMRDARALPPPPSPDETEDDEPWRTLPLDAVELILEALWVFRNDDDDRETRTEDERRVAVATVDDDDARPRDHHRRDDDDDNTKDTDEPTVASDPSRSKPSLDPPPPIRKRRRRCLLSSLLLCAALVVAATLVVVFPTRSAEDVTSTTHSQTTAAPVAVSDNSATPSVAPTQPPTTTTTTRPSLRPTIRSSWRPSTSPSTRPSTSPSTRPTTSPSTRPTTPPSSRPTTASPSGRPSAPPTVPPSASPSSSPTTAFPTVRAAVVWSRADADGDAGDGLGRSVALSSDGRWLWAGGLGALRAYALDGGGEWFSLVADVASSGWIEDLAVSDDGSVVVAGEPHLDGGTGRATVYLRDATNATDDEDVDASWIPRTDVVLRGRAPGDDYGTAVAARRDDDVVVVAAGAAGGDYAERVVLRLDDDDVLFEETRAIVDGPETGSSFGASLALIGDEAVAGAPDADAAGYRSGAVVWISFATTTTTTERRDPVLRRLDGDAPGDRFGFAVAASDDGAAVAVGAAGGCYVAMIVSTTTTSRDRAVVLRGAFGSGFGHAVALSADGGRLVVGAPHDDEEGRSRGRARAYDFDATTSTTRLVGDFVGDAPNDQWGTAVAASRDGTRIAIGAHRNDDAGDWTGRVRLYEEQEEEEVAR